MIPERTPNSVFRGLSPLPTLFIMFSCMCSHTDYCSYVLAITNGICQEACFVFVEMALLKATVFLQLFFQGG